MPTSMLSYQYAFMIAIRLCCSGMVEKYAWVELLGNSRYGVILGGESLFESVEFWSALANSRSTIQSFHKRGYHLNADRTL